ncbi:MAG: TonB C-terminal domain-containing protein [Acidobacteriia bacterium]|nr:TonB C-terminal domain-containing protein [Terriglobia bacterium]
MASHADILDQPERLGRPFWGSVFLHVSVAAAILSYTWIGNRPTELMGDPHGGGIGSVAVTPVASIKLPSKEGPVNPVANDTQSHVPEPPAKKKAAEKVKPPDRDAIPIKSRNATKKTAERASSQPNKWREQQQDRPNQLYTPGGQAISSPMYNMPGGGGLQIGNDSPFGTQFGAYAKLLRDTVARHWNTSDFDSRLTVPPAVVTFTIRRDGSLAPGSVRLTGRSGNAALDISAQRAVLDAAPFPPLPAEFSKNEAQVELRFNLK